MIKYILGFLLNICNIRISTFALIDHRSFVSKKARINRGVKVYDSKVDSYSYVGRNSNIICADIGKFCSIAENCSIGMATHSQNNISTSPIFTRKRNGTGTSWSQINTFQESHHVSIGNDVWIGTKAIIMGGVNIGHGAIIGAGAIVTKDIPDYAIAVGVPAKVIKYRFEKSIIDKLSKLKWWNLPENQMKEKIKLFQIENITLEDLDKF